MRIPLVGPDAQWEQVPLHDPTLAKWRPAPAPTEDILEFGRFRIVSRRRELLVDGLPVKLGTRAFDILLVLIEAEGALVTKAELLSRVWPDVVVSEDNLKVQISELRSALGSDRDLVRTEFGRGYRFTGVARRVVAGAARPAPETTAKSRQTDEPAPTDLAAIVARLTEIEQKLAEALRMLTVEPQRSAQRFHSHAGCVASSGSGTRAPRRIDPRFTGGNTPKISSDWAAGAGG